MHGCFPSFEMQVTAHAAWICPDGMEPVRIESGKNRRSAGRRLKMRRRAAIEQDIAVRLGSSLDRGEVKHHFWGRNRRARGGTERALINGGSARTIAAFLIQPELAVVTDDEQRAFVGGFPGCRHEASRDQGAVNDRGQKQANNERMPLSTRR
jgi:hypothetical protein